MISVCVTLKMAALSPRTKGPSYKSAAAAALSRSSLGGTGAKRTAGDTY